MSVEVGGKLRVDNASFSLHPGDTVGLVGRNGAGQDLDAQGHRGRSARRGRHGLASAGRRATSRRTRGPRGSGVDSTGLSHVLSGKGLDAAALRMEKLRLKVEETGHEKDAAKFARVEEAFRDAGGYRAESEVRTHRGRARSR